MSNSKESLPKRQLDLLTRGALVLAVLTSGEFTPEEFGLTDADVSTLEALVSGHRTLLLQNGQLRDALKGNTAALSGAKGSFARLAAHLRRCANRARVSDAPADALLRLAVKRKTLRGTRRNAPADAPAFTLDRMFPGRICVRFRETGSASPRARAKNAEGVHVAVVDAANPVTSGEADRVPLKSVSHPPAWLETKGWPASVRLYARWFTRRGETSPWSTPLTVNVA